jgi:hypothetical protein
LQMSEIKIDGDNAGVQSQNHVTKIEMPSGGEWGENALNT